jgi:excisionase family DNA binding protein
VEAPSSAGSSSYARGVQDYLTLDELAAALDVNAEAAYRLVRAGEIYGVKVQGVGWRVPRANLEAYQRGEPQTTPVP